MKRKFKIFEKNAPRRCSLWAKAGRKGLFKTSWILKKKDTTIDLFASSLKTLIKIESCKKLLMVLKNIVKAMRHSHTCWVFPIDNVTKALRTTGNLSDSDVRSYAYLEDKDVNAIITSDLKDHPLLLIPKKHRQKILDDMLSDIKNFWDDKKVIFLYWRSSKETVWFDALLRAIKEIIQNRQKYIRVERFLFQSLLNFGGDHWAPASCWCENATDHDGPPSRGLPPSLQSINLFNMTGEVVCSDRGVLEFSDLLKRPR